VLNVILSGGIYHQFEQTSAALAELWARFGVESLITEDVDEAIAALGGADVFTLNALRWRMLDDEKYVPFREQWAFELSEQSAQTIECFVREGGRLLALHTASICFDTWPRFKTVLGGIWRWKTSFHPDYGPVAIRAVGNHDLNRDEFTFELNDEIYHHLDIGPDSSILLEGCVPGGDWHPIAWAQELDGGRVVYDALGHDPASIADPNHQAFLLRCLEWLLKNT